MVTIFCEDVPIDPVLEISVRVPALILTPEFCVILPLPVCRTTVALPILKLLARLIPPALLILYVPLLPIEFV